MTIGQFMPMLAGEAAPYYLTSFEQALANNSGTSYSNRLVRVLINPARLAEGGKRVRLRFSPKTTGANNALESVFIGYRAATGNPYDFDPAAITQVFFNNGATANINVGSPPVWSDGALFELDNTRELIVSIGYSSATQQSFTIGNAANCTTYFKDNGRSDAGSAVVTGTLSSSVTTVVTLDRIEVSKW